MVVRDDLGAPDRVGDPGLVAGVGRGHPAQRGEPQQRRVAVVQHPVSAQGMLHHLGALRLGEGAGLVQDAVGDADLADVVSALVVVRVEARIVMIRIAVVRIAGVVDTVLIAL